MISGLTEIANDYVTLLSAFLPNEIRFYSLFAMFSFLPTVSAKSKGFQGTTYATPANFHSEIIATLR